MFEDMKIRYFIVVFILVALSLSWLFSIYDIPNEFNPEIEVVATLFLGYYFYKQKISVNERVDDKHFFRWLPVLFIIALLMNTFTLCVAWFQLYSVQPNLQIEITNNPITVFIIVKMIMTIISGPIAEEFIFRGFLLNRLIKKTNMWIGIIVSSLLFSFLHFNPLIIISTFIFSIIAALLYLKTHNLIVPILLHMFHNSFVFIQTSIYSPWQEFFVSSIQTNVVLKSTLLAITSVIMIAIILYLINEMRKKVHQKQMTV